MKSLHKVLDIIDFIAASGRVGIREISDHTGFPPPTTHRIVSVLVERHYLERDSAAKNYALSLKFLELGSIVQQRFDLVRIARPHLELAVAETRESASLIVRDGEEAVYLDHVADEHMLQLFTRVGARVPLYATGGGKALLEGMTDGELTIYLKKTERRPHTAQTITDEVRLRREVAEGRKRGYAIDNEEMEEGIRCVAAPIHHHNGRIIAALSVSGAAIRISRERLEEIGRVVGYRALVISRALGFKTEKIGREKGIALWRK